MSNSTKWNYRTKEEFHFMGKKVKIVFNKARDMATITIDKKKFKTALHTLGTEDDNYIKLWMCEDAYIMVDSPEAMAKQLITYWYQYN